MNVVLTDMEISQLVSEKKILPINFKERVRLGRAKRGHRECDIDIKGENGGNYRLILRQNVRNTLDFSVILGYQLPNSNRLFRLRRYNGKHGHTNFVENDKLYDFHVHYATQRYQEVGSDEDAYAEVSSLYFNMESALQLMIRECNFIPSAEDHRQTSLDLI